MQFQDQKRNYIDFILFLLPLIFAFGITYYNSVNHIESNEAVKEDFPNLSMIEESQTQVSPNYIVLPKGKKLFLDKTCLVYKGISNGTINMDVTLLELDPDIAYPHNFTKESAHDGIWLGNVMWQVVKVKKNTLHLRIIRIRDSS